MNDAHKLQLMAILLDMGYDDAFVFNVLLEVEKGHPMGKAIHNVMMLEWGLLK